MKYVMLLMFSLFCFAVGCTSQVGTSGPSEEDEGQVQRVGGVGYLTPPAVDVPDPDVPPAGADSLILECEACEAFEQAMKYYYDELVCDNPLTGETCPDIVRGLLGQPDCLLYPPDPVETCIYELMTSENCNELDEAYEYCIGYIQGQSGTAPAGCNGCTY